jgi:hypothetical protein
MKKLTDKKLKEILKNCSFEINGKQWRIFKKSQYYKWIFEIDEEFTLHERVRDCAGQFMQAIRYLNL